jgi:anti-sigma factor RsiW
MATEFYFTPELHLKDGRIIRDLEDAKAFAPAGMVLSSRRRLPSTAMFPAFLRSANMSAAFATFAMAEVPASNMASRLTGPSAVMV